MSTDFESVTYFDTPFRTSDDVIRENSREILSQPFINDILEGMNNAVVILDYNRQIVAFNLLAKKLFEFYKTDIVLGKRLGEALNCIHSDVMPSGCGTSQFCQECGVAQALKNHKESFNKEVNECRITTAKDSVEISLDLKVSASSLRINTNKYIVFTIQDISDEKRRHALERIFFHDILNTAGAIRGISEVLQDSENFDEVVEFKDLLAYSSNQLIQEIQSQRELVHAENGQLKVNQHFVKINWLLDSVFSIYSKHDSARSKILKYEHLISDETISTDMVLLTRSLGNLIKNALEATTDNNFPVVFWTEIKDDSVLFHVKNNTVMPENIQLQMFQRSFSTKGERGRGIGTYSVKLLVQQYLNGKVYFVSNEGVKTIFTIELPLLMKNKVE
jgi:signal transduction histidine kinase